MRTSHFLTSVLVATSALVGCMDSADDELAAEEAAEAAASGKSDGAEFPFGFLTAFEIDHEDKEPVVAIFHKPDAETPAGESGMFDLSLIDGEYDALYHSGTFKTYTYRGRNRIRFQDDQGHVVLRSDWSLDEDGDLVLGEEVMTTSNPDPENNANCLVVDVIDSNVFEEGLTVYEYPDVSIGLYNGKKELDIGGATYTDGEDDDTTVTITETRGAVEGVAKTSYHTIRISVPAKAPRRGEILQTLEGEEENLVAEIVCR